MDIKIGDFVLVPDGVLKIVHFEGEKGVGILIKTPSSPCYNEVHFDVTVPCRDIQLTITDPSELERLQKIIDEACL
ncbi:MAG TPA: hypothetical protein P5052_03060 [Candidatus Paceibacterota bacterium]|jgi:hypothetical protein|nr:hypothetical protein [Candidatus Paceibacterota bacterium]HRZ29708.1 hypothetical protein [Candidatus Paceibacterota bacterium]